MPAGVDAFFKQVNSLIERVKDHEMKGLLQFTLKMAQEIKEKEVEVNRMLEERASDSEDAKRLMTIPGVGPITALCMLAVVEDVSRFEDARKFGAYLGLTPREFSSGEKHRLGAITRSGPEMLRRYLIHGSRSVLLRSGPRLKSDPGYCWAAQVKARGNANKAVVALAHRMARVAYGLMKHKTNYDPKHCAELEVA